MPRKIIRFFADKLRQFWRKLEPFFLIFDSAKNSAVRGKKMAEIMP